MKLLVVIDMQNDFVNGVLGTKEAEKILPNVQKKIREYRSLGYPVIFTRDTHSEDYLTTQEGRNLPVTHCVLGSKGWEIVPQLETGESEIIDKPSFGSLELARYIDEHYPDTELELVGVCTDICVISNAMILKASNPEVKITVDAACCAGVTPESHGTALRAMKACQIAVVNE